MNSATSVRPLGTHTCIHAHTHTHACRNMHVHTDVYRDTMARTVFDWLIVKKTTLAHVQDRSLCKYSYIPLLDSLCKSHCFVSAWSCCSAGVIFMVCISSAILSTCSVGDFRPFSISWASRFNFTCIRASIN